MVDLPLSSPMEAWVVLPWMEASGRMVGVMEAAVGVLLVWVTSHIGCDRSSSGEHTALHRDVAGVGNFAHRGRYNRGSGGDCTALCGGLTSADNFMCGGGCDRGSSGDCTASCQCCI